MALTISPKDINLDTIRNLDLDKQYYLSKSGEIKEASGWMKFKCMLGFSGARQKVANLIDTVRATLLNSAEMTNNATLDTDISTIRRDRMVSGEDLYNLATRFAESNPQTIAKNTAERMIAKESKNWALVMKSKNGLVAKDLAVLEKVPYLCVNSASKLRATEKIEEMVNNIKDALDEVRQVAKQFPGCAESLKRIIVSLGSSPMPRGMLTEIARTVQSRVHRIHARRP